MHAFLSRHLPPRAARTLAVLWYALLVAGILICYQGDVGDFLYLQL